MALYKNNPTFSKGASCSCAFYVRVLLEQPLKGRTEGAYEEDEDIGGVTRGSRRPFLFLIRTGHSRNPKGFVLGRMFL